MQEKDHKEEPFVFLESLKALFWSRKKQLLDVILVLGGLFLIWNTISLVFDILGFSIGVFLIFFGLSELKMINIKKTVSFVLEKLRLK